MNRKPAPSRGPRPNLRALRALAQRASYPALALWPMHRPDWEYEDPYLDAATIDQVVPRAEAGDRTARLVLRGAVEAHAAAGQPPPPRLLAYLGKAMGDPAKAFGIARGRGRDAHTENLKRRAAAAIVAFLDAELGGEAPALERAAGMLGYRGPTRARTLARFCGEALAALRHDLDAVDPGHREWRRAWRAVTACNLLSRIW